MLEIKSLSQFNALQSSSSLLIIDFYATWCGPCKAISPVFARLSTPYSSSSSGGTCPGIVFAQVDVDKAKDVAQTCGISAMPTFQFFKGGVKIDEVKGADVQQLSTKVGFYIGEVGKEGKGNNGGAGGNAQGSSSSSGSGGGNAASASSADKKPASLRSRIDVEKCRLVNATLLSSIRNIASPPPAGYSLASTASPKLLIYIPFTVPVIPSSITIRIAPSSSKAQDTSSLQSAPSRLTVGSNVPVATRQFKDPKTGEVKESHDLDMESSMPKAEGEQAFNVFSDEYVDGLVVLKLKASKFGKEGGVRSLLVRVERNLSGGGATPTRIGELDILGVEA